MRKILALTFISACYFFASPEGQAQSFGYANEALTLSRYNVIGTARTTAMGGAQVALGADLGGIFLNPAGLGVFNNNELAITPALKVSGNDAFYLGSNSFNDQTNFHIGTLGAAFGRRNNKESTGWLGGSFGISYQQLANFNDRFSYEGSNAQEGLINRFIDAFETGTSDLLTDLAYESFLVGDYYYFNENGDKVYFTTPAFTPDLDYPVTQRETVTRSGNLSVVTLAYGGNISDVVYIGAGLNLTGVNLQAEKRYQEIFQPDDDVPSFTVVENQDLTGSGLNVSFGIIGRPLPFIRLGLSYHTPTYYNLTEQYTTNLDVVYNNFPINRDGIFLEGYDREELLTSGSQNNINDFVFQLRTPSRLNIGSAIFIGKTGFITTDVEFVNYSNAKLTDNQNFLGEDNRAIVRDYQSAVNIRLGGEYRYDVLRLRGGYAYFSDPYKMQTGMERYSHTISAGAGLKFKSYYIDLALSKRMGDQYYAPYENGQFTNYARVENSTTTALLTLGLNF